MHIKIASIMLVASILGLGAIAPVSIASAQSESAVESMLGGTFASVKTEITDEQIVITIDRNPNAPPIGGGEENVTLPEGPIIIVPPNNTTGENGTIILPPVANETVPEAPVEGNVTVVEPDGNITQIEPPTNVTVIDNDTVVIAPPDQPVTETPGNVTVIDPPVVNATEPGIPEECGCPIEGVSGGAPDIQAPGGNVTNDTGVGIPPGELPPPTSADNTTIIVEQPATTPPEESSGDGGNGNGDGNDGDNNGGG